jgi:DNA-directed RNA polymerase subunit RPC12/RpoP
MPMQSSWLRPNGLRPTLRHLMILVVHSALLFSLVAPFLRSGSLLVASIALPLSPPLLAGLVLLLDAPGPVKYWLVGLIASPTLLGFVAWLDFIAVAMGRHGLDRVFPLLVLLNVLGLASLFLIYKRLPGRCPECGKRSMLPLAQLRWCASCGFKTILQPRNRGRATPPAR